MATDRLTAALTPAIKTIRLRVCRECLATRDMVQSLPSFGEGASEASGTLAMTAFSADYQSADLAYVAKV